MLCYIILHHGDCAYIPKALVLDLIMKIGRRVRIIRKNAATSPPITPPAMATKGILGIVELLFEVISAV
jgi:hypothetical protein